MSITYYNLILRKISSFYYSVSFRIRQLHFLSSIFFGLCCQTFYAYICCNPHHKLLFSFKQLSRNTFKNILKTEGFGIAHILTISYGYFLL